MKEHNKPPTLDSGEMLPEYDFSDQKGVRGKYFRKYRQGHTTHVHREDGSISVQHYQLEDGAVMLDPDVREFFSDSDTVNRALRGLIKLIPRKLPEAFEPGKA